MKEDVLTNLSDHLSDSLTEKIKELEQRNNFNINQL